jgi:hypothetical protein
LLLVDTKSKQTVTLELKKIYTSTIVTIDKLVTTKIELPQSQYDIALSIATRLNQENVLKEPKVEELIIATLRILIDEYKENSRSVVTYYVKRQTLDTKDKHT